MLDPYAEGPLVLVVDDDPALVSTLRRVLMASGYQVVAAESGLQARETLEHLQPQLILLDLKLPDADGLVLAATLKTLRSTPIIVMSARSQQVDRVLGLKLGADDFVAKPFDVEELLARIEAVLRRTTPPPKPPQAPADRITIGELTITPSHASVSVGNEQIHLTPTEYRLLVALARHVGETVSRDALLQLVWGYQDPAARHIVDVFIGRLRLKLQQRGLRSPPIVTVRGAGFKLVPEDAPPVLNEREPPLPRGGPQDGDELELNVT